MNMQFPAPKSIRGRAAEIATLGRMLRDSTVDKVILCGPVGIGKSTLAAEALRRDGRPSEDRPAIDCTISLAVGDTSPSLSLGPLPVAPIGAPTEICRASPAIQLFVDRITASRPGTIVEDPDLETIAAICRCLDGWPLAIVLAAERLPELPLSELRQILEDDVECRYALVPRPHTALLSMDEALERTIATLDLDARVVLYASAMFADGFTREAVTEISGIDASAAASALIQLADRRLVEALRDDAVGPGWYRLPRLVRLYVRSTNSVEPGHDDRVARFLRVAQQAAEDALELISRGFDEEAIRTTAPRSADLIEALDILLRRPPTAELLTIGAMVAINGARAGRHRPALIALEDVLGSTDLPVGVPLATALVGYAELVIHSIDGLDRQERAIRRWERGVGILRREGQAGAVLWALAVMVHAFPVTQDAELTSACLREGLDLSADCGDARWRARFEAWSGMFAHQSGDVAGAVAYATSALARGRRSGDDRSRLLAGLLLRTLPAPHPGLPGGTPSLEELVDLARRFEDPRMESILLVALASQRLAEDRIQRAAHAIAQALDRVADKDSWIGAGIALLVLVSVAVRRGYYLEAANVQGMILDRLPVLLAQVPPHDAASYRRTAVQVEERLGRASFQAEVRRGATTVWEENLRSARELAFLLGDDPQQTGTRPSHAIAPVKHPALTPRERQTLALMAKGHDNQTIARQLGVSLSAVWHHATHIFEKLGVANRGQAIVWALDHADSPIRPTDDPAT